MCSDTEENVCTAPDLYLKENSLYNRLQNAQHKHGYAFVVLQGRGDSPEAERQYYECSETVGEYYETQT